MDEPSPATANHEAALILTLGYNQLWFDTGLLSPQSLVEQYQTFCRSDDQHTEHYRYGTFRRYLDARAHLTDQELTGYLRVALAEQDATMGGTAVRDLFTNVNLTDKQFAKVCEMLEEFPSDWTAATRVRHSLLRQLAVGVPSATLFSECLTYGDNVVQKALVEVANADQLAALAASGSTRSIKYMAAQKLKKHSP